MKHTLEAFELIGDISSTKLCTFISMRSLNVVEVSGMTRFPTISETIFQCRNFIPGLHKTTMAGTKRCMDYTT